MVTVILLGVTLAFETKEPDIMERPPRNVKAGIVSKELLLRIVIVGVYITIGAYGLFKWELMEGHSIESARTAAVNVVVMAEVFYLLNCRSLTHSMFKIGLFSNPILQWGDLAMIVLQVLFNYIPAFHWIFESAPTTFESWGKVILIGVGLYLLVEYKKWLTRHAKAWWDARQNG
jgi:Ca2+-transporting ATPase